MVVILWGIATISLFLSRPCDALVDVETSSSPQQSVTGGEDIGNTTISSSVILNNLAEPSAALLQDEEELDHELSLSADERGLGKGRKGGCKGQGKVEVDSKRRKSSKNRQKVDVKAKKQQGQRQKPNLPRRKSGQKNKGQETRYKKKQTNNKKRVIKEGNVKPVDSGKKKTPSSDKKGKKPGKGGKRRELYF